MNRLSKYKEIDLSAYKSITVENINFINTEFENIKKNCIRASDILNCISVGITAAVNDRIPYSNTPILIQIVGALGVGKIIKHLPYTGIAMAGITWGISGNLAKAKAQGEAVEIKIETERMSNVLSGIKAVKNRVIEGESLLYALSGKLKKSLDKFQSIVGDDMELTEESAQELDNSVRLIKSIKQVIETDICNADGFLTKNSGIVFRKINKEIHYV